MHMKDRLHFPNQLPLFFLKRKVFFYFLYILKFKSNCYYNHSALKETLNLLYKQPAYGNKSYNDATNVPENKIRTESFGFLEPELLPVEL